jgi:mono/diheme cytochrome c family protein
MITRLARLFSCVVLVVTFGARHGLAAPSSSPNFDTHIKPILAAHCLDCHNREEKSGGLVLGQIPLILKGGPRDGPSIVPGNSRESPLIKRLRGDKKTRMPKDEDPLPEDQIELIAKWIDSLPKHIASERPISPATEKSISWPFTKLVKPEVPRVKNSDWVRNPIDAFALARMESHGILPAPPVSKRVLLRRLYFDLIGLPPTPQEMRQFFEDSPSEARADAVNRLLKDSRYGERWGRHWLDLVRYADTGGGGLDFSLPHMWRYRDYVIRAFNQDRPYDRFIREQIAGDAFPIYGAEGRIGAGYLRLGVFVEGTREEIRRDLLNDVVGTTGSVFLGLTVGCARCHDHKFDPIPTRDYYRLEAFFASVTVRAEPVPFTQYESPKKLKQKREVLEKKLAERKTYIEKTKNGFRARIEKTRVLSLSSLQDLKDGSTKVSDGDISREMRRGVLFSKEERQIFKRLNRMQIGADNQTQTFDDKAYTAARLLGAPNSPAPNYPVAPTTFILDGGNPKLKEEAVEPGFLSAATGHAKPVDLTGIQKSRRKYLANWIASSNNPLTARVMVNRIWQHHFGRGLVATPSDFGKNGAGTAHRELIDWLAAEFIESGWSIKAMHRLMLSSNLYRQSTKHPSAVDYEKMDPQVKYLWRMQPLRLEAETIRDSILAVSGTLNLEAGGPGFFPEVADVLLDRADTWWEPSPLEDRNRRSIYMLQKRAMVHPLVRVFDGANVNESCAVRDVTTVTPQVFALFNSEFAHRQSKALAKRIVSEVGDQPESQIKKAFDLAFQRSPTAKEQRQCQAYLKRWPLPNLCLVLLNLNEFVFLE